MECSVFKSNKQAVRISTLPVSASLMKSLTVTFLVLSFIFISVWGYIKITDPTTLPIKNVRALGDFSFVTEKMLHTALSKGVDKDNNSIDIFDNKGFFSIDVELIKKRVEEMPWIKQASVQRVWPDALVVDVVEHKAVAYWGKQGLVSESGQIFYPNKETYPNDLPIFIASTELIDNCLHYFNDASEMFASINLKVLKVTFSSRQALTLTLYNGVELNLGRQNKLYRLQRFVQVYSTLSERMSLIKSIDMRYTNGFSVKWKQHQAKTVPYDEVKSGKIDV